MTAFVDPRTDPHPKGGTPPARTTPEPERLTELHRQCREARLYEVERWIQTGGPLQLGEGAPAGRRRVASALEIALEQQNHALVLLLLSNGYDANLEPECPLDLALRVRRWDLLDLLLDWGANARRVSLDDLFGTYNNALWDRFLALGVDLAADHALAQSLAEHTSNKPLFGFAKRHRSDDPGIQNELNIALVHHAGEGNEKGVHLCLWAGADPHTPATDLRFPSSTEESGDGDDGDYYRGTTAVHQACSRGHVDILRQFGPDPARDNFQELYEAADSGAIIDLLAQSAQPNDVGAVIQRQLLDLTFRGNNWLDGEWRSVDVLEHLFRVGARWEESPASEITGTRQLLLKLSDRRFVDVMKLLAEDDHCSPNILRELGRTPKMRERMRKVGFFPPTPDEKPNPYRQRPTRSREVLAKFGVQLSTPKEPQQPKPALPQTVQIGRRRVNAREIRMDRAALFKRIWSEPVSKLAAEWGVSGPGLAKACRRLKIPVPPRGFWACVQAGQRPRRPGLDALPAGQAEQIVAWAPE